MPKSSLRGVRCGAILVVRRLEVWALETRQNASRLITRELLSSDCIYYGWPWVGQTVVLVWSVGWPLAKGDPFPKGRAAGRPGRLGVLGVRHRIIRFRSWFLLRRLIYFLGP